MTYETTWRYNLRGYNLRHHHHHIIIITVIVASNLKYWSSDMFRLQDSVFHRVPLFKLVHTNLFYNLELLNYSLITYWWIRGSLSEKNYILRCDVVKFGILQPTFRTNILLYFKGRSVSPARNQEEEGDKHSSAWAQFLMVACLAYSSTLHMESICSSKMSAVIHDTIWSATQMTVLLF
jgi:hypothetical protein